jgi:hypothetical protein
MAVYRSNSCQQRAGDNYLLGKGCKMLTGNADVVLANLDWLMVHLEMKLDYAAGVVRDKNGEPEYLVADLATAGLTPATELLNGREFIVLDI